MIRKENVVRLTGRDGFAIQIGGELPIIAGERLNPTGRKALRQALTARDFAYVAAEAAEQARCGAGFIDLNAGMGGEGEGELLREMVMAVQQTCELPIMLDSSSPEALAAALPACRGRVILNAVNASEESMAAVFPLAAQYHTAVVCLSMDEGGVPPDAEGRLTLAEKIAARAETYGLGGGDLIFDPLVTAACADPEGPSVTLATLRGIHQRLEMPVILGLSNVSYGMPDRPQMNAAFLGMALEAGADSIIADPLSLPLMFQYRGWLALRGIDEDFTDYLAFSRAFGSAGKKNG